VRSLPPAPPRSSLRLGLATPAAAALDHSLSIRGTAVCDAEAREWVITWALTNLSEASGTIGNVRAYPAGRPLVGLPNRVQPGETITGTQRTLASEYTAYLVLDVNWDDGPVTYDATGRRTSTCSARPSEPAVVTGPGRCVRPRALAI
jgi:hypothetical protein